MSLAISDKAMTFSDALSEWLAAHSLGRKSRTVDFNTEIFEAITLRWTVPEIQIGDISRAQLLEFAKRVDHYCPSRWNAIVSALRFITPAAKCLPRRKARGRDFTPPTQDEFTAFLHALDTAPRTKAGLVVRFLAYTGLRHVEAYGLTWLHVFPNRIDVPREISKNGKSRSIPMTACLESVLARLRPDNGTGFILPRENPRTAIETASRKAFGVTWSFHCLRHFFATRAIESQIDVPTVARWLGHVDGGALLSKTYFHLADDHSHRMAAQLRF